MSIQVGVILSVGNTVADIILQDAATFPLDDRLVGQVARAHRVDFVAGYVPKVGHQVKFDLQITSMGDRNARQIHAA